MVIIGYFYTRYTESVQANDALLFMRLVCRWDQITTHYIAAIWSSKSSTFKIIIRSKYHSQLTVNLRIYIVPRIFLFFW